MSEESRLGREAIETTYALKQLVRAGVEVWFYLEKRQRTLDSPTEKIMLSLTAYADEMEREKAQQRTYDAMRRKAVAGHVTGGRVFGYDNVPVQIPGPDGSLHRSHVERRINRVEAEVVQRVFELCSRGHGLTAIAKTLNGEHVACPRSQQGRPRGWAPSSLRAVLLRELYHGEIVWNKTRKRDKWGAVRQAPRPERDRISVPAPHLRIVSDELWDAVRARFESMRKRALRTDGGKLLGRPPGEGAKHLLAGLLTCKCGASMEARSRSHGRRRAVFYGCSAYHRKGTSVCTNNLTLPAAVLEEAVLKAVEQAMLEPKVVEAALTRAAERITGAGNRERRLAKLRKDLSRSKDELQRLVDELARCGDSRVLAAAIRNREQGHEDLQASLTALESGEWTSYKTNRQVQRALQIRIENWRGLLRRHPAQGQQILKKLIDGRLLMTPHID